MNDAALWRPTPDRAAATTIDGFRRAVEAEHDIQLPDSQALHTWSVEHSGEFWDLVWRKYDVIGERGDGEAVPPSTSVRHATFFPGASLNFAENLLGGVRHAPGGADGDALVFVREDNVRRVMTWRQLTAAAHAFAGHLIDCGVTPGDRVAAWMPNSPETVVAMLGASLVGAVFTSTSPDFGVAGVLDRFGQVEPTVLVSVDGYVYATKQQLRLERLAEVVAGLPSLRSVVVVGELADEPDLRGLKHGSAEISSWRAIQDAHARRSVEPVRLPFDAPGFVLYSSGTTGKPKCIVHRGAGLLLKHATEHRLHCDIRAGDTVMYFTTCGWMMWNWLVSVLAVGATALLYDGSPFHPEPARLWDLAQDEGVTLFGTSAKYLDAARKAGLTPRTTHDLAALRTITSTGSPLSVEGFEYVYRDIATDVHLASISGGTDICGCFVLGDPTRPVYAGEIQGPALGVDVDVLDDEGASLRTWPDVRGELVCRNAFPSMPVQFWADPDGVKYHAAYFDRFPGIWAHGDFASWTEHGGLVIHGRSDATLNAGGVRIGTAEIYRQVEQLPQVHEGLAIGQAWDDDTRIVLFVRLADGVELDDDLRAQIKQVLRDNCSPRHVPARIVAVADLPRTRSGKLAQLAVADVVHGREVRNVEALANPESLELFEDVPELAT